MDRPTVALLLTAPSAGEPMVEHPRMRVLAGLGAEGDRYVARTGHWSDPRWPDQQLTLVESELAAELDIAPALLRRNVVTSGLDLSTLIGREFRLGSVRLRGVRPCDPCRYLDTLTRPGLYEQLAGRGGVRVDVLEDGIIAVGDAIEFVPVTPSG